MMYESFPTSGINIPDTNEYAQWQAGELHPPQCECDETMNYNDMCDDCRADIDNHVMECPCAFYTDYEDLCPTCKGEVDSQMLAKEI